MAKKPVSKKKTSTKSSAASGDNVVRIKASSSTPKKAKVAKEAVVVPAEPKDKKTSTKTTDKQPKEKRTRGKFNVFASIGGYFKGAWVELRQVRWPTRRATWSLTGAVLVYSAFFVVLVLLLDAGFKYLFELILGK